MFNKLENILRKNPTNPTSWLIGLSGIMMVRFFLESISSHTSSGIIASDASTLIHYYLFFLGVALSTLIFLHFALPSWRNVLPQFVSLAFLMILVAPIVDLIVSKGLGFQMTYLFDNQKEMLHNFLTFFGPNWKQGITIGIRVELALIIIFTGALIYSVRKNIIKTLGFCIILYTIVFIFGSLPGIISFGQTDIMTFLGKSIIASATFTDNLHSTLLYSNANRALEIGFNFLMAKILFFICIALSSLYLYLNNKTKFLELIRNSRPERVLAYFSVIFFGMLMAMIISPPIVFAWNDYISIIVLLSSFYFSWVFAVCTNDLVDEDIDVVSNTTRPLIQNSLTKEDLKQGAYISLVACIISGYLSGFYALFCVLTFTALYYIYSMPPTRFKQIPFLASFLIGLCKLSAILAGFFLISGSKVLATFPTSAIFGVVTFFTLFVHLRDLKDIEGDKLADINTPAVMFGPNFIGTLVALAYLLIPIFTHVYYIYITAIPSSLLSYYFCNKKPYKELPLFIIYFVFWFFIIIPMIIVINI